MLVGLYKMFMKSAIELLVFAWMFMVLTAQAGSLLGTVKVLMIKDFTSETEVRLSRLEDFEGNYAEIVLSLIKM